jgi:hypothetical protein
MVAVLGALVAVVAVSVHRVGRPPILAVVATLLAAAGAALYLTAAPDASQLTASVLVGRG